ncbi:hypothetical protein [Variovorax sp.]|uniref:hypothetical protein n=1 Tax=Variovorax sp. TaxID=1871043 RepID=UPI003BAD5DA2
MAPPEVVTTKPCPLVPAFKERPILFSAPMVRALLDGSKTQTRRVVKPPRGYRWLDLAAGSMVNTGGHKMHRSGLTAPYGQPGDRLWVRETFQPLFAQGFDHHTTDWETGKGYACGYPATAGRVEWIDGDDNITSRCKPAIHMPRWASRIDLEVLGVRVEHLQDISEADAIAEGCKAEPFPGPWWQGYKRMPDGELVHQQATGESPPDWMVEPHRMRDMSALNRSAKDAFRTLWGQINGPDSWAPNPWVWVIAFRRLNHADQA